MAQPDILLIMADQLTAFALPSYGHPVVKAPHIAALAEQGVLFETRTATARCAPRRGLQ